MEKINSTGTLWLDDNLNYFSYNTQLTGFYKGLKVFNNTFYSQTTRKHQSYFKNRKFDLVLTACNYGTSLQSHQVEEAIKKELNYINDDLQELIQKRNTQKKLTTIQNLNSRKEFLISVLNK